MPQIAFHCVCYVRILFRVVFFVVTLKRQGMDRQCGCRGGKNGVERKAEDEDKVVRLVTKSTIYTGKRQNKITASH